MPVTERRVIRPGTPPNRVRFQFDGTLWEEQERARARSSDRD